MRLNGVDYIAMSGGAAAATRMLRATQGMCEHTDAWMSYIHCILVWYIVYVPACLCVHSLSQLHSVIVGTCHALPGSAGCCKLQHKLVRD